MNKDYYRGSVRMRGYDYAGEGWYFITLCAQDRTHYFGEIIDGKMRLSAIGEIIREELLRTGQIRPNVRLDEWEIMPNHLHAIIRILYRLNYAGIDCINTETNSTPIYRSGIDAINTSIKIRDEFIPNEQIEKLRGDLYAPFHEYGPQSNNLFSIVRGLKGAVIKRSGFSNIWQSRFHDRIIRDERALFNIRNYIKNNIANWQADIENKIFLEIMTENARDKEYSN